MAGKVANQYCFSYNYIQEKGVIMKEELFYLIAKILKKRKAKKMEKTLGDVIQLTKLNELMKKGERNEKVAKTVKIILICVGAFTVLAAIGYVIYKMLGRRCDDYDLYDDLDNYYDEADHYDIDLDVHEGDFAE